MNTEIIQHYSCLLQNYLMNEGVAAQWAIFLNVVVNCIIVLVAAFILDIIFRKFIVEAFKAFSDKTETTFDDYLVKSNFPRFFAHLLPLVIIYNLIPIIFVESPFMTNILLVLTQVYLIILCIYILCLSVRFPKIIPSM